MRIRWRNRYTFSAGFVPWLLAGYAMLMFGARRGNSLITLLPIAGFFLLICYATSVASMFSIVVLRPSCLVVVNPGARYRIPWKEVMGVDGENGLKIVLKGGSKPIESFAYQSSLVGRLAGSPSSRRVACAIRDFQKTSATMTHGDDLEQTIPWIRHLWWLSGGWVGLALVLPGLGHLLGG